MAGMLDNVKMLIGITDTDQNEKINWIITSVSNRLKVLLGGIDDVPVDLAYIVEEVSIVRFNRIGSEGLSSHSVEGESLSYNDNDFAGFMDEIQAYNDTANVSTRGKVRFL